MPVKSKSQARFMRAVASGQIENKSLSRKQAQEFVEHVPTKNLPERVGTKKDKKEKSKTPSIWPKRGFLADE